VSKLANLPISLGAALAIAPFAWTPLTAQGAPVCTGPQTVELRSVDLATGTGRSATLRGTGAYAGCSWTTDETGRVTAQVPLEALPTLDGSTSETCSLPVVGVPTEVATAPVTVEVLLVDPAPAVEGLLVWRGTARSISRVPSWAERVCAEAQERQMAARDVPAGPPAEVGWGVPGLDEIEALVRASSEVQALLASRPAGVSDSEAYPAIVRQDGGVPVRQGARIILIDGSDPAADPIRHVHLTLREATPTAIQVAVHTGGQGEIELRWVRSVEAPDWTQSRGF
jgi:hypothetical protein